MLLGAKTRQQIHSQLIQYYSDWFRFSDRFSSISIFKTQIKRALPCQKPSKSLESALIFSEKLLPITDCHGRGPDHDALVRDPCVSQRVIWHFDCMRSARIEAQDTSREVVLSFKALRPPVVADFPTRSPRLSQLMNGVSATEMPLMQGTLSEPSDKQKKNPARSLF